MHLGLGLQLKMTQTLRMTPRLQQAIKLLQYNHLEMVNHVQEALLENPTLEAVPDSAAEGSNDKELALMEKASEAKTDLAEQQNGEQGTIDWEKILQRMSEGGRPTGSLGGTVYDDLPPIETNLTYGESLADHLLFQLKDEWCGADEFVAAQAIIHNLDHRGYLVATLEELGAGTGLEEEVVLEALEIVQGLDPMGCGARDLSECLVIQALDMFPEDENFPRILKDHLHNLERRNYQAIARDLELDVEDVVEYHRMIQNLEPLPGRGFTGDEPRYITPDIFVVKRNGEWHITLNEDGMPDLRISKYYRRVLEQAGKEDRDYLLKKLQGAEFLIKSINKRRTTIRRVMESILNFQIGFFERGVEGLRPLVLQEVADDVGRHMSTVSRVTTNKYVHTPHGTFELKYFFSAGVRQNSGGDMAAEAIKGRIKALVANENRKKPLSDQAIANALKQEGVRLARRTVAKYREAMQILPSSQRKKMF